MTATQERTPERPPERTPGPGGLVGLSTTATGRPVPSAIRRARGVLQGLGRRERLVGWLGPIALTLLAFVLRLIHLGSPRRFAFDETYYAKDAWSLLNNGFIQTYLNDADGNPKTDINADILSGHTQNVWTGDPSLAVHPDVGKWLIALGEKAFGMDPFGWRISAAVAGALMVLVMCRLVRRLTGSTMLGCVAGVLLMFDGMHFVLSRLALLDIFLALFLLCGVACIVADRDWLRARLARRAEFSDTGDGTLRGWGPRILFRPWLLAGGVCFGLAVGTKWTALPPLAALGVLCWLWSAGARRSLGVRWAVAKGAVADGLPAFVHLVVVAGMVYIATWGGWLAHAHEYEEKLSSTQYRQYTGQGKCVTDEPAPGDTSGVEERHYQATNLDRTKKWPTATEKDATGPAEIIQSLRSLWYYHQDIYTFHSNFLDCATHFYQSKPRGWLLLNRPVGIAVTNDIQPDAPGCDAPAGSDCIRQVLLIGTPVLWWGGVIALLFAVVMWIGARDWRYGLAVVGALSTWLPWMRYDDRPIFIFYAIAILPFTIIAITLALGHLIGPSRAPSRRRTIGVIVGGAFVVLTIVNFAWFYPILSNQMLTHREWLDRMWFSRWI